MELLRRPRQVPHTLHPSGHLLPHVGLHPCTCANAAAQKPVMRDNLKVRVLREHLPGPFLLALLHHQNTLGRLREVAVLGALLHQGSHPGQNSLQLAGRRGIISKQHLEELLALVIEDLGDLLLHHHEQRLHSHTVQEHGYRVTLGAPVLTVEDLVRAIHEDHLVPLVGVEDEAGSSGPGLPHLCYKACSWLSLLKALAASIKNTASTSGSSSNSFHMA
mmetsp:Transcript_5459/g.7643  ORF Transcript_5459/g.7643 Transcript_5459/m.7643 type:complete len:219 (-) Transcript_5459:670-1326(-)